jgi:hypothetical protein
MCACRRRAGVTHRTMRDPDIVIIVRIAQFVKQQPLFWQRLRAPGACRRSKTFPGECAGSAEMVKHERTRGYPFNPFSERARLHFSPLNVLRQLNTLRFTVQANAQSRTGSARCGAGSCRYRPSAIPAARYKRKSPCRPRNPAIPDSRCRSLGDPRQKLRGRK